MVLIRFWCVAALAALLAVAALPAAAHENHQQAKTEQRARAPAQATPGGAAPRGTEEPETAPEQAQPKPFGQRMVSWVGRTHPFAVHFPIALFPVALVALLLARRRGERVELIRALIVVAGGASVVAGALGWVTAGFTFDDPDWLHAWHRAIGSALMLAGAGIAIWAWRRRDAIDGRAMPVVLALVTATLLVQGWLGAALAHGMGHMMF